jgi:ActR/RegA family two-component response regulator
VGRFDFAVAFREVPERSKCLIEEAVLRAIEEARLQNDPSVLLFDESGADRHALDQTLAALDRRTFHASTILDALPLLQDPYARVEVALVDWLVSETSGLDVLAFLAEEFANVRRVLMVRDADASAVRIARSSGHAQAILIKPAQPTDLATAIGPSGKES